MKKSNRSLRVEPLEPRWALANMILQVIANTVYLFGTNQRDVTDIWTEETSGIRVAPAPNSGTTINNGTAGILIPFGFNWQIEAGGGDDAVRFDNRYMRSNEGVKEFNNVLINTGSGADEVSGGGFDASRVRIVGNGTLRAEVSDISCNELSISSSGGNDKVEVKLTRPASRMERVLVGTDGGNDAINVIALTGSIGECNIDAGNGADSVRLDVKSVDALFVNLAYGDDTFTLWFGSSARPRRTSIAGGPGYDRFIGNATPGRSGFEG